MTFKTTSVWKVTLPGIQYMAEGLSPLQQAFPSLTHIHICASSIDQAIEALRHMPLHESAKILSVERVLVRVHIPEDEA